MKELLELYLSFFRIGLLTFGGGYAMLPMLQREVVDKHGWITQEDVLDCYAIGQCTPGVIAVNTATFVGYRQKGTLGGLVATLGVITPSVIIITLIALLLRGFASNPYVVHAFAGIRIAVAVLSLMAVIKLYRSGVKGAVGNALMGVSFLLRILFSFSPVLLVLAAVILGIILEWVKGRRKTA
ncbi:MAG: chromate transporter [Oscillospiraceae bacterium]|nr:chromate transporter [Oscillospiraceae bacterium]